MLQGLDPVLEGVVKDLHKVTDFTSLLKLQGHSVEATEEASESES